MTGEGREEEGQETKEREQERGVPSTQAQLVAFEVTLFKGAQRGAEARDTKRQSQACAFSWASMLVQLVQLVQSCRK